MTNDGVIGECGKCGLLVKLKKSEKCVSARVLVTDKQGRSHTLMLFNDVVWKVLNGQQHTTM